MGFKCIYISRLFLVLYLKITLIFTRSDFGILKNDSIFDGGTQGNKAFLKTRLLENLNNFFPSISNDERLEILTAQTSDDGKARHQDFNGNSVTDSPQTFPTLIPYNTENDQEEQLEMSTAHSTKIRNEGRITSVQKLDTIRDWRKRLYKAFKNRSAISRTIRKSPDEQAIEMNDGSPTIMDKNRQIILSRRDPNWQGLMDGSHIDTYGRDPSGKVITLLGSELAADERRIEKTVEPYPPREIRYAYRTTNRQPVVYVPAASVQLTSQQTIPAQNTIPVPAASYLANPISQPIQLHILPPIPSQSQQSQIIYQPPTTSAPQFVTYSTFAPPTMIMEPSNGCAEGQCRPESDEEKCNSQRLQTIIFNNIVNGDAESSKRAVQSAAEAETGLFFDAICGTGFFSYIAHTDEFCLASSGGVNCYVFAPVCQNTEQQRKKLKKAIKLSKN